MSTSVTVFILLGKAMNLHACTLSYRQSSLTKNNFSLVRLDGGWKSESTHFLFHNYCLDSNKCKMFLGFHVSFVRGQGMHAHTRMRTYIKLKKKKKEGALKESNRYKVSELIE